MLGAFPAGKTTNPFRDASANDEPQQEAAQHESRSWFAGVPDS
jgi:hypothetical protein